jgi:ParB-like chromosome segregation protein Spo0J
VSARRPAKSTPAPQPQWPADRVERWPIERLIPYARNARTHSDAQVAALAASIREWGWTMPALVDEAGTLIAGHGRVLAARQLDITEIPTMVARGWTEAQIKAYRIADNQLPTLAGWDQQLLGVELAELQGLGANIELIGFSTGEADKLMSGPQAPSEFGAYDETIETEHVCPKCGFRFSGGSAARTEEPDDAA